MKTSFKSLKVIFSKIQNVLLNIKNALQNKKNKENYNLHVYAAIKMEPRKVFHPF